MSVLPSGNDSRFKRHAFFSRVKAHSTNVVLVHYIGDESIATDFPHGNARNNQPYYRTCPSLMEKLTDIRDLPGNIYKDAVSKCQCPPQCMPVLMPRNTQQIANLQKKERQKLRFTHDAIYNLHEVAYELDDYVKVIKTYPDLVIVCGLSKVVQELNAVLKIHSDLPQLLSYDTTFQLGDFYLSPLLFRHTLFTSLPVIPAIFLIHERKFQRVHEELMQ